MATQVILALVFSLLLVSQVSSDLKNNEERSHVSQALHVRDRKLMGSLVLDISEYFRGLLVPRALAPAPTPTPAPAPSHKHVDCGGLCKYRCGLHSRQNLCLRACGTCCARCNCVPPGTSGNREMCGKCYTDMTTHANKTKCP